MRTNIIVENNYLWVPIWANGEKQFLTFTVDGEKTNGISCTCKRRS